MSVLDYRKLSALGNLVRAGQATPQQRDEFMQMMFLSGKITQKQYDDYKGGRNTDDILKATLAIGAIALFSYLLGQISKEN